MAWIAGEASEAGLIETSGVWQVALATKILLIAVVIDPYRLWVAYFLKKCTGVFVA